MGMDQGWMDLGLGYHLHLDLQLCFLGVAGLLSGNLYLYSQILQVSTKRKFYLPQKQNMKEFFKDNFSIKAENKIVI